MVSIVNGSLMTPSLHRSRAPRRAIPAVEHLYQTSTPPARLRPMSDDPLSLLAAGASDLGELAVEGSLRPRTLDEYIGQREVKASLDVLLQAAKGRGEAADHVLLYGPPGLGKTTLATIIARELGVNVRYTSGPAVERAGDLAAILTALDERDVLFIDEIHRLNRAVEEILYPAMEDFALDVMIGKGPSARSLRLNAQAVHGHRRDDARGPDQRAAARPVRHDLPARLLRRGRPDGHRPAVRGHPGRGGRRRGVRAPDRQAWPGHAPDRQPAAPPGARPRGGARRRHDPRRLGHRGDEDPRHRRAGPRHDRPQAARRDHPEVRLRPRRRPGARGGPRRGAGDDRGRVRAVPPAPRASSTGRRRAGSRRSRPASTSPASGSRSRPRAAPSPTCRRCGTTSRPGERGVAWSRWAGSSSSSGW